MSSAIIKFEDDPNKMIYWKDHAYPAGLGFKLVDYYEDKDNSLFEDQSKFEIVKEVPQDIQYEYIVKHDHTIHCQECWFTKDRGYHGGGFRHGGVYDLKEWQEKIRLQNEYSYRNEEAFNDKAEYKRRIDSIIDYCDKNKNMFMYPECYQKIIELAKGL